MKIRLLTQLPTPQLKTSAKKSKEIKAPPQKRTKMRKGSPSKAVGLIVTLAIGALLLFAIKHELLEDRSNTSNSGMTQENPSHLTRQTEDSPRKDHRSGGYAATLKSIEEQRRKEEAEGTANPVPYDTFGQAGRLTTAAAEAAQLTPTERAQVEKVFSEIWQNAADRFAADASLDEARSNSSEGNYVYQIRALPDRGTSGMEDLQSKLESIIGAERQKILTKGMNKYDCFGGFGAFDIQIEFSKLNKTYTYKFIDPKTGKPTRFGTSSIEEFTNQFGDTFDLSNFH